MTKLFIEKYKPRKIEDLILDDIIHVKLRQMMANKTITNMILTGETGVGKTSTVNCIARNLYSRKYSENILELNACDERGIKFVYETITNFCKTLANYEPDGVQHKLLILDEANNLMPKAQKNIVHIMNKYKNTRFIFTCNNTLDIIEAIQSRCLTFKFFNIPKIQSINKFKFICKNENISYDEKSLEYLYNLCHEDIRKTINMLEIISKTYNHVSIDNINDMYNLPSSDIIKKLIKYIIDKKITKTLKIVNTFKNNGYYPMDILLYFIDYLQNEPLNDVLTSEEIRISIIEILVDCSYVMSTTSASYLHITNYLLLCIDKI
jgi:DNA polymerase III delta prime subunit